MKPKVLFIVDYDPKIGAGHLNRALALIDKFTFSHKVHLVLMGKCKPVIKSKGINVYVLDSHARINSLICGINPQIIICDLRDPSVISGFHRDGRKWVSLEDWALVKNNNITVINPNIFSASLRSRANGNLLGAKFYPLKSKLLKYRKRFKKKPALRQILINFGGSDQHNLSEKVVRSLLPWKSEIRITVVRGGMSNISKTSSFKKEFRSYEEYFGIASDKMYRLISQADLAIIAGGVTAYECAVLGCPMVLLAQNKNQAKTGRVFQKSGYARFAGEGRKLTDTALRSFLKKTISNYPSLILMSQRAYSAIDGLGADRIYSYLSKGKGISLGTHRKIKHNAIPAVA